MCVERERESRERERERDTDRIEWKLGRKAFLNSFDQIYLPHHPILSSLTHSTLPHLLPPKSNHHPLPLFHPSPTMAEPHHCIHCFDVLVSHYDKRKPISLDRCERIYHVLQEEDRLNAVINLKGKIISIAGSPVTTPRSIDLPKHTKAPARPLFVTWNKDKINHRLRGCIGTFESQALESGLATYAITA